MSKRIYSVIALVAAILLAGIIAFDSYGSAAGPTTTTVTTTATVTAIPRAVSATVVYGVPATVSGVMVFTRNGDLLFGYYNGTHYIVVDVTKSVVVSSFACNIKTVVASYQTGYVVCGSDVYDAFGRFVYHLPDVPSFMIYDYYSDRILAFINAYPAAASVAIFDASGRTIYIGTWTNYMVYGAATSSDSYYILMYNAASGWWLARYDKGFSRILAFINAYPAAASVAIFDASGRTIYIGTWTNYMVYGATTSSDSYYILMYNAASGWWLARYDKGFSRILANISIPTPMNNNVAVAKYSAFAANDYGVLLINSDGSAVMYSKDLKPLFMVSGNYTRVAASKYHFYLMDSSNRIYATSGSGVVYIYGVTGDVHYARVSKEFWDSDKGVAYNSGGYIYILDAPSDLVFVTTTSTVYMLQPVTRTFTSTETTTVYGFVPAYSSIALFIALIVLVAGIYYFLKKK